ncbi:MAG: hypothetical protein ACQERL_09120 [Bacillota bacterium]
MRKVFVLMVALMLVFTGFAMAQNGDNGNGNGNGNGDEMEYTGYFDMVFDSEAGLNPDIDYYQGYFESDDDGIVYFHDVGDEYVNLKDINRERVTLDGAQNGKFGAAPNYQGVEVELPAYAYIPCFLEIKVTGNLLTTSVASFGPQEEGEFATGSPDSPKEYNLTFDNEVGGFVDEEWNSLGYGQNVEFNLQEELNAFIRGCDIFAVEVASNADYRYAVSGSALTGPGGSKLDMYMRTQVGSSGNWLPNEAVFTGNNVEEEYSMENIAAGTESLFIHDFKVPFEPTSTHGEYNGAVYFRAATI